MIFIDALQKRIVDRSLKSKVTGIVILVTGVTLASAGGFQILGSRERTQNELLEDLAIHAESLGLNCISALDFDDAYFASETLDTLKVASYIKLAGIYRSDGSLFASYTIEESSQAQDAKWVTPPLSLIHI